MGSGLSLKIPASEETVETGKQFYQYHVDRSEYYDSVYDVLDYEYFQERLESHGRFMIYQRINNDIIEAAPSELQEVRDEHTEDGYRFTDREGMEAFAAWLESARTALAADDALLDGLDRIISKCQHMIEFALEHDYEIAYSH